MINTLDNVSFRLNELHDFSWLKKYGTAVTAFDETGSGCIGIGMQDGNKKVFCKIAGVGAVYAEVSPPESVELLKKAVGIYSDLKHPNLIKLTEHYEHDKFYIAVFEWENGESLFDHWNFDKYSADPALISPKQKFLSLPSEKKLKSAEVLFSFLQTVAERGYAAVDFYDGSLMYDFEADRMSICDIDLFLKRPVVNTMGEDWWGTKRLKAPEEYALGALIDEQTMVFTLGALLFDFFGSFSQQDIERRYAENRFIPCGIDNWQLDASKYAAALKAVDPDRNNRFKSIAEFWSSWNSE